MPTVRRVPLIAVAVLVACSSPAERASPTTTTQPAPERRVVAFGTSSGMCSGYCTSETVVSGRGLVMTAYEGHPPDDPARNSGQLTPEGRRRLDDIERAFDGVTPLEVYGCPDCADGGASWFELVGDDGVPHRTSFETPSQPPELGELPLFADLLWEALARCRSNEIVTVARQCRDLWPGLG